MLIVCRGIKGRVDRIQRIYTEESVYKYDVFLRDSEKEMDCHIGGVDASEIKILLETKDKESLDSCGLEEP